MRERFNDLSLVVRKRVLVQAKLTWIPKVDLRSSYILTRSDHAYRFWSWLKFDFGSGSHWYLYLSDIFTHLRVNLLCKNNWQIKMIVKSIYLIFLHVLLIIVIFGSVFLSTEKLGYNEFWLKTEISPKSKSRRF